jgi:hypothetical protein
MKNSLKAAALAVLAVSAIAGSANAAVTVSHTSDNLTLPAGQAMVWDFDGLQAAGYGVTTTGPVNIYNGADGLMSGISAPPPGDLSNYVAVLGGGALTLSTPAIKLLSVYMGSPDQYNSIQFNYSDNTFDLLDGNQLSGGAFNGDQSIGRRMTYTFGGKTVTSVVFSSSQNSFEFDNIATVSAVPEPATWAMMIMGFGLAGSAVRNSRRKAAATFA